MDKENIEPHEELEELLSETPMLNEEPKVDLNAVETGEEKVEPVEEKVEEPEPKGTTEETVPPTEDNDARFQALLAKSQDEVAKRQRIEAEMMQMRQQMQQMAAEQQPKIDPYQDPEGYARQQEQNLADAQMRNKVEMSEMIIKAQVGEEDYDGAIAAFQEAALSNPALSTSMINSSVPAKFAYDEGKRILAMKEIGDDPEAFKAAMKEQLRSELLAELKPQEKVQESKQVLPETIANTGSSAPSANDMPDDSLGALLEDARKRIGA